jgi:sugar lactone lactonase YvrE
MAVILGGGAYRYEVVDNWAKLPPGREFNADVTDPGQFNIPHNICCDADGWIYVADRENHRVQVFERQEGP